MNPKEKNSSWYWEIIVQCQEQIFELMSFYLFENGATGILEISEIDGTKEFKVFFSSQTKNPKVAVSNINEGFSESSNHLELVSIDKQQYQNWTTGWRDHFKPICVGKRFLVRPPWEKQHSDKLEIVIDPGQGFGTGYHMSTAIALQLLEWVQYRTSLCSVLDVGTGSGILAIGALLLEATQVTAIDIDQDALKEVPKNLRLSGFDISHCDILNLGPDRLKRKFDLVLANIESQILLDMLDDLNRLTKKSGYLVLSGILYEHKSEFKKKLPIGMDLVKEQQNEEWWGLALNKN